MPLTLKSLNVSDIKSISVHIVVMKNWHKMLVVANTKYQFDSDEIIGVRVTLNNSPSNSPSHPIRI